ncbi:MAG: hypothetical protein LBD99_07055 [Candidatus Margulisbacteria bacterium]|jgi:hypothetical protein|nr:hypothetical protein [Candidatus Margulisiibacteriota bacterium]
MQPKLKHKDLNVFCPPNELKKLLALQTAIATVEQSALPDNLPDIANPKLARLIEKSLSRKNKLIAARKKWWRKMQKKYALPPRVSVNTQTAEFFELEIVYA